MVQEQRENIIIDNDNDNQDIFDDSDPTPGLPQVKWKNYQLLSLERTRYLNQYEKIFFNRNRITEKFHLNRLSWIEKYGPTCPVTQRNKIKTYVGQFTVFHPLSDLLTTHYVWSTLQNRRGKMKHTKPGHIWNKPSLTPELWHWTPYRLLMRFAKNRLSKQLSHLPITNHQIRRKYLERNYMTPLKLKTKQTNCLTTLRGNANVHRKIVIKSYIPLTPTSILDFHHQIRTTKVNLKETISINTTNHKIRETITAPASHLQTARNRIIAFPIYNWRPSQIIQGKLETILGTIVGYRYHHSWILTRMAHHTSTPSYSTFIQKLQHIRSFYIQDRNQKSIGCRGYRRNEPIGPVFYFHTIHGPKKTGDLRPVIDLRSLNQYVKYQHFKMESLDLVKSLIRRNDYMVSIDLNQAFYHVPLASSQTPYFAFDFLGKRYCFKCLPFGLTSSPRVFTKILRPLIKLLRAKGIRVVVYLDDLLIMARTKEELLRHTDSLIRCLQDHGFTINQKKSCLTPSHVIDYLGFQVDSKSMLIKLPKKKIQSLIRDCRKARQLIHMPI